jgi:lipopolysaccharide transport system ATP-binding protein
MTTAISIENISKKYIIRHQKQGSYLTLRDTLTEGFKTVGKRVLKPNDVLNDSYEEFWALRDVSVDIKQGDRVGIIGRNGAGKSTLLKILSRITEPTSGRIKISGRVASLLEVGTGFHPELTGRENIFLNGAILGMSRVEISKKFDDIVEFAEVEKFLDTPVKRYSSGMYVRLAFAVAAHLEPEILIVDEVLAVGDAKFQKKCLGKMEEVGKGGRTVLFVSHNMAAIKKLCNTAVLISNGTVKHTGETQEVLSRYFREMNHNDFSQFMFVCKNEEFEVVLNSISLVDNNGHDISALQTGSPGAIKLSLNTGRPLSNVLMAIDVDTLDDTRVCIFHSVIAGTKLDITQPKTNIVCNMPNVTLAPGRYKISVKLVSNDKTIFQLQSVKEIDVVEGDFYGTGRLPESSWGALLMMEHEWKNLN